MFSPVAREVCDHALTQQYRPRPDDDKPPYTEMQNKRTGATGWKETDPEDRSYSRTKERTYDSIGKDRSMERTVLERRTRLILSVSISNRTGHAVMIRYLRPY